jgi:putative transposase
MTRRGRYGVPMQVYGSILPGAATLARLLPKAASEAREARPPSREAKRRLIAVRWYEEHGKNASLTARHFAISRSSLHIWLKRYRQTGPRGLEDRSRRPRRVRQPTWLPEWEAAVLKLRQENPRWGKDVLTVILRRDEGLDISVSMVGRILSRLKREGRLPPASLKDPCMVRRPQIRPYATRKPKDYLPQAPGDLVQVDTADVRLDGSATVYKHFAARDFISRWDVLDVHHNATAHNAANFLDTLLARTPFEVRGIQVDGGSEFKAEFEAACQEKGLLLFVLPPRSPKLNGRVERSNRTHKEEFYQLVDPPDSLVQLRTQLLKQEQRYNTYRPHQALGYKTPQAWLLTYAERR